MHEVGLLSLNACLFRLNTKQTSVFSDLGIRLKNQNPGILLLLKGRKGQNIRKDGTRGTAVSEKTNRDSLIIRSAGSVQDSSLPHGVQRA